LTPTPTPTPGEREKGDKDIFVFKEDARISLDLPIGTFKK